MISRTDTGVHALNSAVVVDLERKNGKPYDCEYITNRLNKSLADTLHKVRVNHCKMVPKTFNQHINAVKSRTYMYRIAVIKKGMHIDCNLDEKFRCHFLKTYVILRSTQLFLL